MIVFRRDCLALPVQRLEDPALEVWIPIELCSRLARNRLLRLSCVDRVATEELIVEETGGPMYVERALFVVAPQDSGKSTQLRSIFLDRRFGKDGEI